MMGMRRTAAALLALSLLGSSAGAHAQGGFTLMSPEQERQLGQQEHPKILQEFGGVYDDQVMTILRKTEKGVITRETLPVRFVPMVKKRD